MTTPREIVERLLAAITNGDWAALPALYAEDAIVEHPFAMPAPVRLVGRTALQAHFAAASRAPFELRATNVVLRGTDDPEVVVVEYDYEGRIRASGHRFRVANVQVVRVRDGQIVASRDYHDHRALADAARRSLDAAPQQ